MNSTPMFALRSFFCSVRFKTAAISDRDLIGIVVCFLEVDPHFVRSGYLKQDLLTRIKRSELRPPREGVVCGVYWSMPSIAVARASSSTMADSPRRLQITDCELNWIRSPRAFSSARTSRTRMMLARIRKRDSQQTARAADLLSEVS